MFRTIQCKEHDHSSFYKFLEMEKNHKNTDCYFYYYSTCTKGDNCAYRHEVSALGCETVCSYWQQGSCLNQHCNFRHMEIKKNRKAIPCYWEKSVSGCKKPHCPFLHRLRRPGITNPIEPVKTTTAPAKPVNQEWPNRPDAKFDGNSTESEQGRGSSEAGSYIAPMVDPLIVHFEAESDSESAPSPTKNPRNRISSCKTYEEIRLEEIQAESAAFYSYGPSSERQEAGGGKAKKIGSAKVQRIAVAASNYEKVAKEPDQLDFQVLSLEEIRRRKKREEKVEEDNVAKELALVAEQVKKNLVEEEESRFLKEATSVIANWTRKKRRFIEVEESKSQEEIKNIPSQIIGVKVPPVRLKRPRLTNISQDEEVKVLDDRKLEEERKAKERLDETRVDTVDASNSNRRQSVEVRLCDSSTDGNQTTQSAEGKDSKLVENLDNVIEQSTICYSAVKLNKGELLSLDTASDDILKDIDALLTDDVTS